MSPAIGIPILAAAVLGVLYLLAIRPLTVHPLGQHHAGRKDPAEAVERALRASAAEVRAAWDSVDVQLDRHLTERDTTHALVAWQAPVSVPLPDMEVESRRAVVRAQVAAGRARFAAVPSPWADSTDTFRALTARDLGTGGE